MTKYYETDNSILYNGDCLEVMNDLVKNGTRVDKVITSPPYNIIRPNCSDRGYDVYQDGMSNEEYIKWIISVFDAYNRILNPNGCIIWNMSYGGENTELMNLCMYFVEKLNSIHLVLTNKL